MDSKSNDSVTPANSNFEIRIGNASNKINTVIKKVNYTSPSNWTSQGAMRIGFVNATVMQDGANPWDPWVRVRGFTEQGTDVIIILIEQDDARTILGVTAHEGGHALGLNHPPSNLQTWL